MGRRGSRRGEPRLWSPRDEAARQHGVCLGRRDLLPRPDMLHHAPRLRRRLELVFLSHPPGELLVGAERARPITGAVEQTEHSPQGRFVIRLELDGAPGPSGGVDETPFRLCTRYERACRRRRSPPHPVTLAIEPLGELRCRPGDVQPLEQRAAIQRHRAVEVAGSRPRHRARRRHTRAHPTPRPPPRPAPSTRPRRVSRARSRAPAAAPLGRAHRRAPARRRREGNRDDGNAEARRWRGTRATPDAWAAEARRPLRHRLGRGGPERRGYESGSSMFVRQGGSRVGDAGATSRRHVEQGTSG